MIPESYVHYSIRKGEVLPHYLNEADHPWLRALMEEYDRFVGRPVGELEARLEEPLPFVTPPAKRLVACRILARLHGTERKSALPPRQAREAVFTAAARSTEAPELILRRVAGELEIDPESLEESLFGDLPSARLLGPLEEAPDPGELALRANLAVAQTILYRASSVRIEVEGNARALVRLAKLRGLILTVEPRTTTGDAVIEISGPYSLFRKTLIYGRALAALIPTLSWCARFRLTSWCTLRGREVRFHLRSGDPIFPASAPRLHDSKLEERFARDFRRVAREFDLIREPEPIRAGSTMIFPDFAIQRRGNPERRWLLEIVGFWTPRYLETKLAHLRAARIENLILCLDEERNVGEEDLPPGVPVLRYRKKIDPAAVLAAMGGGVSR